VEEDARTEGRNKERDRKKGIIKRITNPNIPS